MIGSSITHIKEYQKHIQCVQFSDKWGLKFESRYIVTSQIKQNADDCHHGLKKLHYRYTPTEKKGMFF